MSTTRRSTSRGGSTPARGFWPASARSPSARARFIPHEQTLSGPKADRLALFNATKFNLSPIFGLYPDPRNEVLAAVEAGLRDRTPLEATDHLGVVNRLWPVLDPAAHTAVQGLMGPRPIFIADGHHRYETGLNYRNELEAAGTLSGTDDPANFCMMMLVGMSDPGLLILPTHRLVSGFPGLTAGALKERLAPEFAVEDMGEGDAACRAAWETIEIGGDQDMLGFGTVADGRWVTARLQSDAAMDKLVPDQSAEWRSLGVSILHELVLKKLLGGLGNASCRYVHLIDEVLHDVGAKGCDLAASCRPPGWSTSRRSRRTSKRCPPRARTSIPSC